MKIVWALIAVISIAGSCLAQLADQPPETRGQWRGMAIQAAVAVGWRFDRVATGHTPVVDFGLSARLKSPVSIQARLSIQPPQDSYSVMDMTIGSFAFGLRAEPPQARVGLFGGVELDFSKYMGKAVLYSADSNAIVGRVSTNVQKTGLALAAGVAYRINRHFALDIGVRKIWNSSEERVTAIPPLTGTYQWPFPSELYNQATLFLQSRVGIGL